MRREFAQAVLLDRLDARHVVIGHGFRFGNRARGTAETLREAGLAVDEYSCWAMWNRCHPLGSARPSPLTTSWNGHRDAGSAARDRRRGGDR